MSDETGVVKKNTPEHEEFYGELGSAFNFTKSDLDANRGGFVSQRQQKSERKKLLFILIGLQGCTIAYVLTACTIFINLPSTDVEFAGNLNYLGLFFIIALAVMLGGSGYLAYNLFSDIQKRRSKYADCQLVFNPSDGEPYLESKSRNFALNSQQFQQLHEQSRYRVYYLPQEGRVLSIEEL